MPVNWLRVLYSCTYLYRNEKGKTMNVKRLETKAVEYGKRTEEWTTTRIVLLGSWYRMIEPYGSRGGTPDGSTKVESISEAEAYRELLSMGAVDLVAPH